MSRQQCIHDALSLKLKLDSLHIENESYRHHVPAGSETHFKIVAVSTIFEPLKLIDRHRLVNEILANEFTSGLHALSLHLYTPQEWQKQLSGAPESPACRNGKQRG